MANALSRLSTKFRILGDFFRFLWRRKVWWLIPLIVVLLLFVVLAVTSQYVGPFVYPVV